MTRSEKVVRGMTGLIFMAVAVAYVRLDIMNNYDYGLSLNNWQIADAFVAAAFLVFSVPCAAEILGWCRQLKVTYAIAIGITVWCAYQQYEAQQDKLLLSSKDQQQEHEDKKNDAARARKDLDSIKEKGSVPELATLADNANKDVLARCVTAKPTQACKAAKTTQTNILDRLSNAKARDSAQETLNRVEKTKVASTRFEGDSIDKERNINRVMTIFVILITQLGCGLGGKGFKLLGQALASAVIKELTPKQKDAIRRLFPEKKLRIARNGAVTHQKKKGAPYTVLLTPQETLTQLQNI